MHPRLGFIVSLLSLFSLATTPAYAVFQGKYKVKGARTPDTNEKAMVVSRAFASGDSALPQQNLGLRFPGAGGPAELDSLLTAYSLPGAGQMIVTTGGNPATANVEDLDFDSLYNNNFSATFNGMSYNVSWTMLIDKSPGAHLSACNSLNCSTSACEGTGCDPLSGGSSSGAGGSFNYSTMKIAGGTYIVRFKATQLSDDSMHLYIVARQSDVTECSYTLSGGTGTWHGCSRTTW